MFENIGLQEIVVMLLIAIVLALFFVVPKALPKLARKLGKSYRAGVRDSESKD